MMQFKEKIISLLSQKNENTEMEGQFPLEYCIPVYHTVSDIDLPHLKHIISYKNTRDFTRDLDFLAKNFQLVTWDEFKNFMIGNFKPKKKIALLTFDDGLREFKTIISPILEQKGIFAINFINPQFIDNQDIMFRCKASLIIEKIKNLDKIPQEVFQLMKVGHENKNNLTRRILGVNFQNQETLNQIAAFLEIDFQEFLKKNQPYLNIEEIHYLKDKGFGFGAHSMKHPLYEELTLEKQLEETLDSLKYLKNNTLHAETFAFPFTDFGVSKAFFNQLYSEEKDLVCTFGSAGIKKDSFSKNFQRIAMENNKSAEETLKEEITYFNIKKWFNKNTIIRK